LPSLITGPACIGYPLFVAPERFERLRPDPAGIAATLSDVGLETGLTTQARIHLGGPCRDGRSGAGTWSMKLRDVALTQLA